MKNAVLHNQIQNMQKNNVPQNLWSDEQKAYYFSNQTEFSEDPSSGSSGDMAVITDVEAKTLSEKVMNVINTKTEFKPEDAKEAYRILKAFQKTGQIGTTENGGILKGKVPNLTIVDGQKVSEPYTAVVREFSFLRRIVNNKPQPKATVKVTFTNGAKAGINVSALVNADGIQQDVTEEALEKMFQTGATVRIHVLELNVSNGDPVWFGRIVAE